MSIPVQPRGSEVLIGQSAQAHIRLASPYVSRLHARLAPTGGDWLVEDLGSENGTTVNGQRIQQHLLQDGDEIHLADQVLSWGDGALWVPADAVVALPPAPSGLSWPVLLGAGIVVVLAMLLFGRGTGGGEQAMTATAAAHARPATITPTAVVTDTPAMSPAPAAGTATTVTLTVVPAVAETSATIPATAGSPTVAPATPLPPLP